MSTNHRRPLFAFVAVFVVAMLVVAGAARSDALRDLVQGRTADIVAATALEIAGEPEPRLEVAAPEAEASAGVVTLGSPTPAAVSGRAAHDGAASVEKARGHARAGSLGKARASHHAKAPGKARGHARGHARATGLGQSKAHARAKGQAKAHHHGHGHGKGRGLGHRHHHR